MPWIDEISGVEEGSLLWKRSWYDVIFWFETSWLDELSWYKWNPEMDELFTFLLLISVEKPLNVIPTSQQECN